MWAWLRHNSNKSIWSPSFTSLFRFGLPLKAFQTFSSVVSQSLFLHFLVSKPDISQQIHFPLWLFHFPYFPPNIKLFLPRLLKPLQNTWGGHHIMVLFHSWNVYLSSCLSFPQNVSVYSLGQQGTLSSTSSSTLSVMRKRGATSKIGSMESLD